MIVHQGYLISPKHNKDVMCMLGLTAKDVRVITVMAMQGTIDCYRAFIRFTFRIVRMEME